MLLSCELLFSLVLLSFSLFSISMLSLLLIFIVFPCPGKFDLKFTTLVCHDTRMLHQLFVSMSQIFELVGQFVDLLFHLLARMFVWLAVFWLFLFFGYFQEQVRLAECIFQLLDLFLLFRADSF